MLCGWVIVVRHRCTHSHCAVAAVFGLLVRVCVCERSVITFCLRRRSRRRAGVVCRVCCMLCVVIGIVTHNILIVDYAQANMLVIRKFNGLS